MNTLEKNQKKLMFKIKEQYNKGDLFYKAKLIL